MTLDPTSFTMVQLAMVKSHQDRLQQIEGETQEIIAAVKALPTRPPRPRSWWKRIKYLISMPLGFLAGIGMGLLKTGAFAIFLTAAFVSLSILVIIEHFTERE